MSAGRLCLMYSPAQRSQQLLQVRVACVQSIEGMTVDTPLNMRKPRKARGEEAMKQKEWEQTAEYEAAVAGYSKVVITGKIDKIIEDVRDLVTTAEEEGHERPPKVVMFSTYDKSFDRVRETLDRESIQFVCAPPARHCDLCRCEVCLQPATLCAPEQTWLAPRHALQKTLFTHTCGCCKLRARLSRSAQCGAVRAGHS